MSAAAANMAALWVVLVKTGVAMYWPSGFKCLFRSVSTKYRRVSHGDTFIFYVEARCVWVGEHFCTLFFTTMYKPKQGKLSVKYSPTKSNVSFMAFPPQPHIPLFKKEFQKLTRLT